MSACGKIVRPGGGGGNIKLSPDTMSGFLSYPVLLVQIDVQSLFWQDIDFSGTRCFRVNSKNMF